MTRTDFMLSKIVDRKTAAQRVAMWRLKNDQVVFSNGCFDILHKGHVAYLTQAVSEGNRLVLGLNTDASVRRLGKGDDRPINDEESRAIVLAALSAVDLIVLFDEDTPEALISELKPDVLVKGADYDAEETDSNSPKYIVGSDLVRKYGGSVVSIPLVEGFSTTSTLEKMKGKA